MSSFLLPIAALLSVSAFGPAAYAQGVVGEFVPDSGFDLSGNWNPLLHEDFLERFPGPELVNYSGLPISEGSRLWGESWNSSRLTMPEHQCQVHVSPYIYRGPLQMRFWDEKDPQSQKSSPLKITSAPTSRPAPFGWTDVASARLGRAHLDGLLHRQADGNILTVYTAISV